MVALIQVLSDRLAQTQQQLGDTQAALVQQEEELSDAREGARAALEEAEAVRRQVRGRNRLGPHVGVLMGVCPSNHDVLQI